MTPICHLPDGTTASDALTPTILFPGSFNPLHDGHRTLAEVVAEKFGQPVHFELSIANVDKPDLAAEVVAHRIRQFRDFAPIWITRAATFATKADWFPGTRFVVGWDTAIRLFDPKYYAADPARRDAALRSLQERECRFIVAGRLDATGQFRVWDPTAIAAEFQPLFEALDEPAFRVDLSSTWLRTNRSNV